MAPTLMAHSPWLARTIIFIVPTAVILCIIPPGWLELPLARTVFHGPKHIQVIEVLQYIVSSSIGVSTFWSLGCNNMHLSRSVLRCLPTQSSIDSSLSRSENKTSTCTVNQTGKCIRRFGGIYAYCRHFIDRK